MFRQIFEHIEGIIYLPIFSLLFFFIFFLGVLFFALRLDKRFVTYMGNLPLESDKNINNYNSEGE